MTYTKAERKAIAAAFRAAKRKLWDGSGRRPPIGEHERICYALESVRACGTGAADAQDVVMTRLRGFLFFESWLRARVPASEITDARVQQHRHAWLDLLIKEFES